MLQALRVSMEEQRQRQEDEARRVQQESIGGVKPAGWTWLDYKCLPLSNFPSLSLEISAEDKGILAEAESADLPYNPVSCRVITMCYH